MLYLCIPLWWFLRGIFLNIEKLTLLDHFVLLLLFIVIYCLIMEMFFFFLLLLLLFLKIHKKTKKSWPYTMTFAFSIATMHTPLWYFYVLQNLRGEACLDRMVYICFLSQGMFNGKMEYISISCEYIHFKGFFIF